MASNLLAYLLGPPKGSSSSQGDSVTPTVSAQLPQHPPPTPTPTWSLPPELWIQILETAPRHTLAHVMLANRALSEVAERILYHTVVLKWSAPEARKFRDSIASCPRRGALVIDISLLRIDSAGHARLSLPAVLLPFLTALPNLQALTLRCSTPIPVRCDGDSTGASILDVRLPYLRSFAASLKLDPSSSAAFLAFLGAHPALDTLDIRSSTLPDLPHLHVEEHVAGLRALACSSRFLNSRAPIVGSLTHLHRTAYLASEVAHIAALLGTQLRSLRLGRRLAMPGRAGAGAGAGAGELGWGVEEVRERFPRLRYLQVDSPYKERPYLDTSVVDWLRPPRPPNAGEGIVREQRGLTIAWTYVEGFWSDAEGWAAAYDAFLDDAAVRCLKAGSGCVERVVYERSIRPYHMVSVRLEQGSERGEESVVRVQDAVIGSGDYWKHA